MGDLEPITRNEKLWSGEDLTPVTRREMYIKHLYDETQVIPEYPVTREEMFILKAGEELHDVTIEQLTATENKTYSEKGVAYSPVIVNVPAPSVMSKNITENGDYSASDDNVYGYSSVHVAVPQTTLTTLDVSANGTYTAPSGTAYSEVDVDVPLPENAYLLKEIEDVEIATFTDGSDLPMPKLEVAIEPVQDLHGYDAPWVGGAGKNKFDATTLMANVNSSVQYVTITLKPNTTYTMSTSLGKIDNVCNLFFMLPNESASSASNGVYSGLSISVTSGNDGQVKVGYRLPSDGTTSAQYLAKQYQIEEGSTATSYAPYSNICPISGWDEVNVTRCGKNLFDDEDGELGKWYDAQGVKNTDSTGYISPFFKIKNSEYTIQEFGLMQLYSYSFVFFDENKNFIQRNNYIVSSSPMPRTVTFSNNAKYVRVQINRGNTLTIQGVKDCMIQVEQGTTATTYEPYNGHTYTLDLDGTRYGGTLDVISGVLTVDRVEVDLGTLSWNKDSGRFVAQLPNDSQTYVYNSDLSDLISEMWTPKDRDAGWNYMTDGQYGIAERQLRIKYSSVETKEAFATLVNGSIFVYPLATPLTIQLSPTVVKSLRGVNNVFADSGNILDLSYLAKEE